MLTMRKLFLLVLLACVALTAQAQYIQGSLNGGPPAPGPKYRSNLNTLERTVNLAGATILTDTFGNQRFALFVHIEDSCINYTPLPTGNTNNLSAFVARCGTDSLWYIDWTGASVFIGDRSGGAAASCDQDWLTISTDTCPTSIDDSIYHQKYASVGARYVWPGATFLVNDSTGVNGCLMVIQGERQNKLAFYDILNERWTMLHGNNTDMSVYVPQDGAFTVTTASGTPDAATADIAHFQVNTLDSTVTLNQYPNTRRDTQAISNFLYTDGIGTVRSQSVDSLPYPDPVNIYTDNGLISEERTVSVNASAGGLLAFQTVFPTNSEFVLGDSVFYTNVAGGLNVSRWETLPWRQEMSSYNNIYSTYIRTFQQGAAQIYGGRTAKNSQILIDTIGVQIKTNNSFGSTGQILRNIGGYLVWQDTTAISSVNIYNSNGSISTNRTVTLSDTLLFDAASSAGSLQYNSLTGNNLEMDDTQFQVGDITNASDGIGLKVDAANVTMGDVFDLGNTYVASGTGGNYIRTDASNLQQTLFNTLWTINDGDFFFQDIRTTKPGVEYSLATLGADFTDSTLVHRRYVEEMIYDSINTNTVQPPAVENIENSNFTALKWIINEVDCTGGAISVTPPASPVIKDRFAIVDSNANAATNNITVDFTGASQKLNGSVQDFIMNCDGCYIEFVYMGSTTGWVSTK